MALVTNLLADNALVRAAVTPPWRICLGGGWPTLLHFQFLVTGSFVGAGSSTHCSTYLSGPVHVPLA
jgi:hypothetical protein